jgi:glycosyltransferase involved in cell wall biosynthesis
MTSQESKVKSVLFIHEVNYKTKPIFEMHEFPEILASKGMQVSFLHFEEGAKFWNKWVRKPTELICGRAVGDSRINLLTPFQLGIPGLDRLIASISIPLRLLLEARNNRPDVVVSYAFPTGGIGAILVCKVLKIPLLQRVIDYSPGLRPIPFSAILSLVDRIIFVLGKNFSTHNQVLFERIEKYANSSNSRVFLNFPPIKTPSRDYDAKSEQIREFLGKAAGKEINLIFIGTLYKFSGIVQAAEALLGSKSVDQQKVALHIFGLGPEEKRLRQVLVDRKNNCNSDFVNFYGFLDFENLYSVLSKCDLGLVPFQKTKIGNFALPNKALQYVAAGLPVVSTYLQGLASVLSPRVLITISNLDQLPTLLADLAIHPNKLKEAKAATASEAKRFSYESSADSLLCTLEEVVFRA